MGIKKRCNKQGCMTLIQYHESYCEEHKYIKQERRRRSNIKYNKYKRDMELQKFYNSKEWRGTREERLTIDNGLCQECLRHDIIKVADMVHHRIPIRDDYSKRLDIDNLISLCDSCHNKQEH